MMKFGEPPAANPNTPAKNSVMLNDHLRKSVRQRMQFMHLQRTKPRTTVELVRNTRVPLS